MTDSCLVDGKGGSGENLALQGTACREDLARLSSIDRFRDQELLSESGKPRLKRVRGVFYNSRMVETNLDLLEDVYVYWRDLREAMILRSLRVHPRTLASEWSYVWVKVSKRGNDVYASRVKRRLNWLSNTENAQFFDVSAFSTDKKVQTSALWVTLTWDTKRGSSFDAWDREISQDFNRFMSALRQKYGRISVLRTWEAFDNGYPHVHACLLFQDAKFSVFPHLSTDEAGKEKLTFRISEKDQVATYWHSHVDVQAVSSTKKLFNYMRKYQTKTLLASDSPKGVETSALMWLFRKRGFSVSGDFRAQLSDLIALLHNSKMEKGQQSIDGSARAPTVWEFVGVFGFEELGIESKRWSGTLNKEQIGVVLERESKSRGAYGDWD